MTRINIEIQDSLHMQAKLNSIKSGKTLIQFINEALSEQVATDMKKFKL